MSELRASGERPSSRRPQSTPPPGVDPVLPPGFDETGNPAGEDMHEQGRADAAHQNDAPAGLGWPLWTMIVIAGVALGIAIALTAAGNI